MACSAPVWTVAVAFDTEQSAYIARLFDSGNGPTLIEELRRAPRRLAPGEFMAHLERIDAIRAANLAPKDAPGAPDAVIERLVHAARKMRPAALARLPEPRRSATLAATLTPGQLRRLHRPGTHHPAAHRPRQRHHRGGEGFQRRPPRPRARRARRAHPPGALAKPSPLNPTTTPCPSIAERGSRATPDIGDREEAARKPASIVPGRAPCEPRSPIHHAPPEETPRWRYPSAARAQGMRPPMRTRDNGTMRR